MSSMGDGEKRMLSGGRNPLGIFCSILLSPFPRGPNFSSLLLTSSFQIRGRGGANFPHVKRRRRVGSKEALPSLPWAIKISSPRCESLSVAVICLAGGLHSSRRAKTISGMSPLLLGDPKNLDIFSFT